METYWISPGNSSCEASEVQTVSLNPVSLHILAMLSTQEWLHIDASPLKEWILAVSLLLIN